MAKLKADKIKLVSETLKVKHHICPISNLGYLGSCCVTTCPANIAALRNNNSGCFYEQGQSNNIDVARWLKLSTHEIKRRYTKGMLKIEKFVMFYNYILNLREIPVKKHCPKCGIQNTHGLICLNGKRCDRRHSLYKKSMQRFPFNVNPLNVSAYEFLSSCNEQKLKDSLPNKLRNRALKLLERGK